MERQVTIIGFGEAGRAFAISSTPDLVLSAYDLKQGDPAMQAALAVAGVRRAKDAVDALTCAEAVLSLVTADQALAAAQDYAGHLTPGALWLDMNSVAPETKCAAATAVEAAGGRYVDVAVMAPVYPARRAVPLLVAGPHADDALALLSSIGFTKMRRVEGGIGAASAIKMIRSVIVKGIEALTAEAMLAADAAGVRDEVLASLDASDKPGSWTERADYNLDRMLVHGLRRAAEMEEVIKTLDALGAGSVMSRGTVERQRALGGLGITSPRGLDAKLAVLRTNREEEAA